MSKTCTICNKPIVLVPSAKERAKRFGGRHSDYTAQFTEHGRCTVLKRSADSIANMRRRQATGIGAII